MIKKLCFGGPIDDRIDTGLVHADVLTRGMPACTLRPLFLSRERKEEELRGSRRKQNKKGEGGGREEVEKEKMEKVQKKRRTILSDSTGNG